MVRFPSPSVTKIKSCMCDLSIFFSFCLELPVCKNSKIIFKGFRQQNRQISRKLETKIENRLEKSPTDYFFYATFSSFKSNLLFETSRNFVQTIHTQIVNTYKYFHGFVHFRINVTLYFCALNFVNTMLTKLLMEIAALI